MHCGLSMISFVAPKWNASNVIKAAEYLFPRFERHGPQVKARETLFACPGPTLGCGLSSNRLRPETDMLESGLTLAFQVPMLGFPKTSSGQLVPTLISIKLYFKACLLHRRKSASSLKQISKSLQRVSILTRALHKLSEAGQHP